MGGEQKERNKSSASERADANQNVKNLFRSPILLTLTSLVPCAAARTEETISSANRSVKYDCWRGVGWKEREVRERQNRKKKKNDVG